MTYRFDEIILHFVGGFLGVITDMFGMAVRSLLHHEAWWS